LAKKSNSKPNPAAEKTARKINQALIVAAVVVAAAIVWFVLRPTTNSLPDTSSLPKPTIETLAPSNFTGTARMAYQAAKEIPEILNQLPCFCGCMQNFGHKSNLYCFRDNHGVECSMCQDIALDALQMHKSGMTFDRIRQHVQTKFGRTAQAH
jgi:hypothetical protein